MLKGNGQDTVVAFDPRRSGPDVEDEHSWLQGSLLVTLLCNHWVWQEATWLESSLELKLVL